MQEAEREDAQRRIVFNKTNYSSGRFGAAFSVMTASWRHCLGQRLAVELEFRSREVKLTSGKVERSVGGNPCTLHATNPTHPVVRWVAIELSLPVSHRARLLSIRPVEGGGGSSALLFLTHFILSSYAHLKKYHFVYKALLNTYSSTRHNHYTTPSRIEIARKHRPCPRLKCREDKTVLTPPRLFDLL